MPDIPLNVTPGYTVPPNGTIDAAMLNMLARPRVSMPTALNLGPESLDMGALQSSLGYGANQIPWGAFQPGGWKAPSLLAANGQKTENAQNIWVKPVGAPVTYDRVQTAPNDLSAWSGRIQGAPGLTSLEMGTYLPPDIVAGIRNQPLVISMAMKNGTNNSFIPQLKISTSNVLGDAELLTEVFVADALQPCQPSAWTRVTWLIHSGALQNWLLGCQIAVTLPLMTDAAHNWVTSQWDLRVGSHGNVAEKFASSTRETRTPSSIPTGSILPWAGDASTLPPTGFLFCNGETVSRTLQKELYNVLGTRWGPGDGIATFHLPDFRERSLVGNSAMGGLPVQRDSIPLILNMTSGLDSVVMVAPVPVLPGSLITGPGIQDQTHVVGLEGSTGILKLSKATTSTGLNIGATAFPTGVDSRLGAYSPPPLAYETAPRCLSKLVAAAANTSILVVNDISGMGDLDIGMGVSGESLPVSPKPKIVAFSYASSKYRIHLDTAVLGAIATAPVRFHDPTDYAARQLQRGRHGRYLVVDACVTTVGSTDVVCSLWFWCMAGMKVTGANIPPDTTITDFVTGSKVRLSKPAQATGATALTFELPEEYYTIPAATQSAAVISYIIKT